MKACMILFALLALLVGGPALAQTATPTAAAPTPTPYPTSTPESLQGYQWWADRAHGTQAPMPTRTLDREYIWYVVGSIHFSIVDSWRFLVTVGITATMQSAFILLIVVASLRTMAEISRRLGKRNKDD